MSNFTPQATSAPLRSGRSLLLLGIFLALAGMGAYFAQVSAHILFTPWYMPILATFGVVLIVAALAKRRTVTRWVFLVLFGGLAALQWSAFLWMFATPAYAGPVKVGLPFPPFTTTLADGAAFSQENLKSDKNSILLFFRGRW
ncbi:MAG: hypothetical protein ACJ8C4_11330 [Gemmataceae bacterium]